MMTPWAAVAPDNSDLEVQILPAAFDTEESNCVMCGGTLGTGWECSRCGADHFPAVKRMLKKEAEA